jgi:hypothetical protein
MVAPNLYQPPPAALPPMMGNFVGPGGHVLGRGGFMVPGLGNTGLEIQQSIPVFTRGAQISAESQALADQLAKIERIELTGDVSTLLRQTGMTLQEMLRGIVSSQTAFPVRENLEAEAKILTPLDTPVRNMLPRVPGAGTASQWRQATSLGGGWGISGTNIDQPGSTAAIRAFFSESGAPAEHTTVYANKTAGYKLLGAFGSVTGFAMAAGANFMSQLATEKTNSLRNTYLNEEHALINGDSTSAAAPWGDGVSALAFDGIINLVTVANGTPTAQVQAAVGPLTLSFVDNMLKRTWNQGAQAPWMLINATEALSFVHLAEAAGSIIRVMATTLADTILGVAVTGYKHPLTGEIVPIYVSRFMPAGTMIFGAKLIADGTPAIDVSVLPQVQLPELAPNDQIQGYTVQELAPTHLAPQVNAYACVKSRCIGGTLPMAPLGHA